jgi:uroporphyrinogen-III synthase
MSNLRGARVALLESRLSTEIAELVRRMGGVPVLAPSVREQPRQEETAVFLDTLVTGRFSIVVLSTGAGVTAMLREADERGQLQDAVRALAAATLVCRGSKPIAALRRHGLQASIVALKPYTTKEVLDAMRTLELTGQEVALVHYGERNIVLADALRARGANLAEVCPYEWVLPDDTEPLRDFVRDPSGRADAVAFTSQVQVRHLFTIASEMGLAAHVSQALNTDVIVAAVGPVCAEALRHAGVTPDVQPADPKMGPLLTALADYIELTEDAQNER